MLNLYSLRESILQHFKEMKKVYSYLITGGSRSGKSSYALRIAESAKNPHYIATGWAGDDEMRRRIEKHKKARGHHWTTIETKIDIRGAIKKAVKHNADCIIVDCLTLWVSNLMMAKKNVDRAVDQLLESIPGIGISIIFVTNELGSGIVPADKLSREFRDNAGLVNQKIADVVDNVVMTVCGIPIQIKPGTPESKKSL